MSNYIRTIIRAPRVITTVTATGRTGQSYEDGELAYDPDADVLYVSFGARTIRVPNAHSFFAKVIKGE
jgi:hypothetical protein